MIVRDVIQMSKMRVGVIGIGFGARVHIPAFQSEGLEVTAVCSQHQERVSEVAKRFNIPHALTDYHKMIDNNIVDVISIASPPPLHYEMTMAALKAKKHVICEKPFALNQTQAKEMMKLTEAESVTAMIAHEFRYTSGRALAKQLISKGYVGELRTVNIVLYRGQVPSSSKPADCQQLTASRGAGLLCALGSHYIDCLRHWFGEVEQVMGKLYTQPDYGPAAKTNLDSEIDNGFNFHLTFRKGGWATMTATYTGLRRTWASIEVCGDHGTLVTPQLGVNPASDGLVLGARVSEDEPKELAMPEKLRPPIDKRDDRLPPFRLLVRDFLKGIETKTSPAPNFYDGYRCQQIIDAVLESHRSGHWVNIT